MQPTPQIAPREVHEIISGLIVVDDRILRRVMVGSLLSEVKLDDQPAMATA